MKHKPLLPGNTEQKEIELIVNLIGSPSDAIWPGYSKLPFAKTLNIPKQEYVGVVDLSFSKHCFPYSTSLSLFSRFNNLKLEFPRATEHTLSLLSGLLTYNPKARLNVKQALRHPYFIESPRPLDPSLLPTYPEIRNQISEKEK
jgi:cyclin-dependent kinase 10